jgi:hypothetical protein
MKLEQEARAHINAKKRQFREALREHTATTEQYLLDNLYATHELENARRNLQAAVLWAEEAADVHGIK